MHTLSHHEWKLVYTAVRKAQKRLNYDHLSYAAEYEEYHHILNKLYPLAYSESYDDSTSIPGKPISSDAQRINDRIQGFINPEPYRPQLSEAEEQRLRDGGFL